LPDGVRAEAVDLLGKGANVFRQPRELQGHPVAACAYDIERADLLPFL
jgi:hypothetical protein